MTTYQITGPKRLQTTVKLPASKSISNRALIIHALSGGTILPENLSDCDDTEVIIQALKNMPEVINIKAAGTAMRFMTAFLAATEHGEHVITGTERMQLRSWADLLISPVKYIFFLILYAVSSCFSTHCQIFLSKSILISDVFCYLF